MIAKISADGIYHFIGVSSWYLVQWLVICFALALAVRGLWRIFPGMLEWCEDVAVFLTGSKERFWEISKLILINPILKEFGIKEVVSEETHKMVYVREDDDKTGISSTKEDEQKAIESAEDNKDTKTVPVKKRKEKKAEKPDDDEHQSKLQISFPGLFFTVLWFSLECLNVLLLSQLVEGFVAGGIRIPVPWWGYYKGVLGSYDALSLAFGTIIVLGQSGGMYAYHEGTRSSFAKKFGIIFCLFLVLLECGLSIYRWKVIVMDQTILEPSAVDQTFTSGGLIVAILMGLGIPGTAAVSGYMGISKGLEPVYEILKIIFKMIIFLIPFIIFMIIYLSLYIVFVMGLRNITRMPGFIRDKLHEYRKWRDKAFYLRDNGIQGINDNKVKINNLDPRLRDIQSSTEFLAYIEEFKKVLVDVKTNIGQFSLQDITLLPVLNKKADELEELRTKGGETCGKGKEMIKFIQERKYFRLRNRRIREISRDFRKCGKPIEDMIKTAKDLLDRRTSLKKDIESIHSCLSAAGHNNNACPGQLPFDQCKAIGEMKFKEKVTQEYGDAKGVLNQVNLENALNSIKKEGDDQIPNSAVVLIKKIDNDFTSRRNNTPTHVDFITISNNPKYYFKPELNALKNVSRNIIRENKRSMRIMRKKLTRKALVIK